MRIGSNLHGVDLAAQHHLQRASSLLAESSLRLSTLSRINRGSDDPAGLIAAETLRAELVSLEETSRNADRARGLVHVADAGLSQVSDLLTSIRANVVSAAGGGLSDAEVDAKQLEVDAAVEAINRIATSTSLGGRKLLDGSAASPGITLSLSPDPAETATLSLPDVRATALGGEAGTLDELTSGGSASLASGDAQRAAEILDAASSQVLDARAQAGAFERYTIDASQRVMDSMEENLSAALSEIADTDVAMETSRLIQSEILFRAAVSTLKLAGQRRDLIADLLGD